MYLGLVHSIPSQLVWAEIECLVNYPLPKQPLHWFKPVQQRKKQALRAYCPNVYTVIQGTENAPSRSANDDGNKASEDEAKIQDGELGLQSQV